MSVEVVNLGALDHRPLAYGSRFEIRRTDVGALLGTERLDVEVGIVPPGKADGPYRYHLVAEEMALVLGGELRIRLGGAEYPLEIGDYVALPSRGSNAHQFLNRGDRPALLLNAATRGTRDVVGMPDSGKRVYRVRGRAGEDDHDIVLHDERVVDLMEGEPVDRPLGAGPPVAAHRDHRIASLSDVEWEPFGRAPHGGDRRRLARRVGAERLGYSVYRVAPGKQAFAFHFHHANEELFLIRDGRGRLRTPDGERDVGPGDLFACRPGIGGAHSILATGHGPLEYFALSTMIEPEVVEYPDADQAHVMVGAPPGGDPRRRILDRVFRRKDALGDADRA